MKCKSSSSDGSLTIKLDISKAYDRVEWVFLERVMLQMGFSDDWVRRIMSCITSVQFCFKLNGSIFGNLVPSWGLRQGDPISPYLFLICADAFFSLLSRAVRLNDIHGVRVCRGAPAVSHLFFADDSIIFANVSCVGMLQYS